MANLAGVRTLLETIRALAFHLTDEEVSEIAKVLAGAMERLERQADQKGAD